MYTNTLIVDLGTLVLYLANIIEFLLNNISAG